MGSPHTARRAVSAALLTLSLAACQDDPSAPATELTQASRASAVRSSLAPLGKAVFNDENLSLRRNQSCASCHDAAWGFSSPNSRLNAAGAVLPGSVRDRFGNRKPPSAAYATQAPVRFFDDVDETYVGGNFWDGRATGARLGSPAAEQALGPFLNPVEMALPDPACVVFRVSKGRYRQLFREALGRSGQVLTFPANTEALCAQEGSKVPLSPADSTTMMAQYDLIGLAVAAFEASPEVNSFSSKYDAVLAGQARFTLDEARGFGVYNGKGGCFACHPAAGPQALFTDYTYDNIGVPANPDNPVYVGNPAFLDLGVGGVTGEPSEHGKVKVPTLRNLTRVGMRAGRKSYMHNGAFKSLEQVVHFYNTRDVLPACNAVARPRFGVNCWPAPEVTENVNTDELGNLGLNPSEEAALVAFLHTLDDGYEVRGHAPGGI